MVTINGEQVMAAGKTIAEYLEEAGYAVAYVAVERNRQIVPKGTYGEVRLEDGDEVEIVRFVGGG